PSRATRAPAPSPSPTLFRSHTRRGGLARRGARGGSSGGGVPAARLGERDREDSAIAVDDVVAEEERDLETRFFYGDALCLTGGRDRKSTRLNSSHQIISYVV